MILKSSLALLTMVLFTGGMLPESALGANIAPTIAIPALSYTSTGGMATTFTVTIILNDMDTPLADLALQVSNYDAAIINSVVIQPGFGSTRTAIIQTKPGVTGSTMVGFVVSDGTTSATQSVNIVLGLPPAPILKACKNVFNGLRVSELPMAGRAYRATGIASPNLAMTNAAKVLSYSSRFTAPTVTIVDALSGKTIASFKVASLGLCP